jgi:hypothetical protein
MCRIILSKEEMIIMTNAILTTNNETHVLNGQILKKAAEQNQELLTLSYYAGVRTRNRTVTDVEQMRKAIEQNGEQVDAGKWLEAFKTLETLGMGALIIGRHGKANRFKWRYSLKAIGAAAISGENLRVLPIRERRKGAKIIHVYKEQEGQMATVTQIKRPSKLKGKAAPIVKPSKIAKAPRISAPSRSAIPMAMSKNVVYVSLRPDFDFETTLPDLTASEAEQICKAIRRCVR